MSGDAADTALRTIYERIERVTHLLAGVRRELSVNGLTSVAELIDEIEEAHALLDDIEAVVERKPQFRP